MRRVVCPGSFDPVTNGHLDVFTRAARLFDEVRVAVLVNPDKRGLFPIEERIELIRMAVEGLDNVVVEAFGGLLVDYCRQHEVPVVLKGLRVAADFDYEQQMAGMNRHLTGVETLFLPTDPALSHISSSLVKVIASHGGDVSGLVPAHVGARLRQRLRDS
ncbi:pantetheine-phosphate adenylyltransferase [Allostreptomyces psammosilenae]|uniref:pantetheine-phosphate adenylyltransferase n=1 Tax=Allostreptomyces psammosilenae TaxID=1892865 RepID=UPI0015C80E3D|nr:pantetheine-phosphate adenylyltransferase [Allostreptomyces psammosilenae]